MTLEKAISSVDAVKPNAFSNATKTAWINEAEGLVQTEIMLREEDEVISYSYERDKQTQLLVPAPWAKLYKSYLISMIDFANGEYDKHRNARSVFERDYIETTRWYAEHGGGRE